MKQVTFYLLSADLATDDLSAQEVITCQLAAHFWRQSKRLLIACVDEAQAIRVDEALWRLPAEAFVPHNLAGEGPTGGAPVELAWPDKRGSRARDLLISLLPNFADFATAYNQVIDFVPDAAELKQLARERYKAYRAAGFQLNTTTPLPAE
jgi:DNA polymerase III subunit chi